MGGGTAYSSPPATATAENLPDPQKLCASEETLTACRPSVAEAAETVECTEIGWREASTCNDSYCDYLLATGVLRVSGAHELPLACAQ